MKKRTLQALLLSFVLVATLIPEESYAAENEIDTVFPTQKEIVEFYQEHPTGETYFDSKGNMLKEYKTGYETAPLLTKPYDAGQLSTDEQVRALNTIRLIRYIAGLSEDVYLFEPYSDMAQAAAMINYVNKKASHNPERPDGMNIRLSALAMEGSANSNIDKTSWQNNSLKSSIIHGWMYDSDAANLKTLGHRRWILNPSLVMTGFGSVTGAKGTCNTMYIRNKKREGLENGAICWPAKNTPVSFFDSDSAWSISVGEEVDAQTAVISMLRIRDYKTWVFSSVSSKDEFYVNNQSYGQEGCIIFKPDDIGKILPGDKFKIFVSYNKKNITYEVNFFDLDHYYSPEKPTEFTLSISPADKPTVEWQTVKDADSYDLYRKAAGGSWKLISQDLDEPYYDDAYASSGIKYYYRIVAKRNVGSVAYESYPSASKCITTKLSKPNISFAGSVSSGRNLVRWKAVSKASGYKIYRRAAGTSKWKTLGSTKAVSYTDKTAVRNVKYEYRIRAYRTTYKNTVYSAYSTKRTVRTK